MLSAPVFHGSDPGVYREWIQALLVTGSKFAGDPPFCGATTAAAGDGRSAEGRQPDADYLIIPRRRLADRVTLQMPNPPARLQSWPWGAVGGGASRVGEIESYSLRLLVAQITRLPDAGGGLVPGRHILETADADAGR